MTVPRILHLHSSFDAGGKELRCVRLINAFGRGRAARGIARDDGVLGIASEGVDQADAAQLLAARVESRMEVQDTRHGAHATLASRRAIAVCAADSSRVGA